MSELSATCSARTQKNIGELHFCICLSCRLGQGSYGIVCKGKFEDDVAVAVKRVELSTQVEAAILRKADRHQNIVRYYITKEDER